MKKKVWIAPIVILALLMAAAVARSPHPIKKSISMLVKHPILCQLEQWHLIRPYRAHYTVERGTVDVRYCTPSMPPRYAGQRLPHPFFVLSDFGQVVQKFDRGGRMLWQRKLDTPRGMALHNGEVLVADAKDVVVLDAGSGVEKARYHQARYISAIDAFDDKVLLAYDEDGPGTVMLYRRTGQLLRPMTRYPQTFKHARGVALRDGVLYVADTFGHRIVKVDARSHATLDAVTSYYPNSIELTATSLIVAEEHLNLVTELDKNNFGRRRVIAGCLAPHGQSAQFYQQHRATELAMLPACQGDARQRLFSQNDAVLAGQFLFIADTDNHRVLVLKSGKHWGEMTGFNDPVNVRVAAHGD